jgi:RND family efflux transporter MFP subunit
MTKQHAPSLIRFIRHVVGPGGPGHDADELLLHRFAVRRDQAAFAALVARHGPMVLGVCCRALRDAGDVEDAFQATFLVLARKARSLARPHLLAHWLHGVARRTALEARARTARRRARQQPIVDVSTPDTTAPAAWVDLRPVLDEEIARLPERYRVPFVLCYLEGRTNGEAARLMGCPKGTVASRLAWARQRLRCRLTRRGVTLSAGFCATALSGTAALRPALAGCTAEAAAAFAGGARAAGPVAATVGSLAAEVLKHMFWTKARTAAGLLLTVGLLLGGGGALVWPADGSGRDGPGAAAGGEVIVSRPLAREVTEDEDLPGITAVDSVEVAPRLGGVLSKANFQDGGEVKQGQLLFEIDPRPFKAALEQAEANLAQREARLTQAEADREWAKKQLALKQIAPEDVERADRGAVAAKADVAAAAAARDIARANLDRTRVNAPLAGRIHGRVAPGNVVRADDAVATIVSPGPAYVYFAAPLRLLTVLAEAREGEGVPVTIGLSDEKGFPRRGTVGLTGARVDADKGTLRLRAVLPNDGVVPGQPARVRLQTGKPYRGLLVPQGALVNTKKGSFLLVLNDQNVVERRPVELGPTRDGLRVVKGGLGADDWVVLGNPPGAQPGMTISPRKVGLLGEAGQPSPADAKPPGAAGAKTIFLRDRGLFMTLPLEHTSAAEALRAAKHVYREQVAPRGPLALTADEEANTLSVEGPADQVLDVVKLVASLEELGRRNSKAAAARGVTTPLTHSRARVALTGLARAHAAGAGPRLGVTVEPVSPALADQLNLPRDVGLLVTQVVPQSPAAKVGVEKHDVLLRIDGAQIPADVDDFIRLIASLKSDTPLDVVVLRKGQRCNLGSVRLGDDAPTPAGKRPADLDRKQVENLRTRIGLLEADVAALKDRVAWSERMARKGYVTEQVVQADRARLKRAETDLDRARWELKTLSPDPKDRIERGRKP